MSNRTGIKMGWDDFHPVFRGCLSAGRDKKRGKAIIIPTA